MKHLIYISLLFLASFTACGRHTVYPSAMQQAEALMNTRPDSALTLLEAMADTFAMLPEETRMYHQLLTIQAKDKLYITHTSDSLINRIVAFYEAYGNSDRLMMAYFYQGSTYRDMNDAPRALKAFHQAIDAGKDTKNLTLLGQTYGQMGTLFSYQKLYDEALKATRKALQFYILQEDSARYSYLNRDIARIYNAQGKQDSALFYYQRALNLGIANVRQRYNILSEIGCLHYYRGEMKKAKYILEEVISENPYMDNALLFLGLIYESAGLLDSARYYANQTLLHGKIGKRNSAYQLLTRIEEKTGNAVQASIYWKKHRMLLDSISSQMQTDETEKYHLLYRFQRAEREVDALKLKDQQKQSLIDCLLLSFFLCIVLIVFFAYSYRKKKKDVENQELRLQQMLTEHNNKEELCEQVGNTEDTILSDVYLLLHKAIQDEIKLTDQNWKQVQEYLDKTYPNLTFRIRMLYPKITQHQLKICYLVKLRFTNDHIARLLISTPASVSIARRRLYEKITGKAGKPEDFNSLISDL